MRTLECEVGAGEASLVRGVNDDAQVADESLGVLLGGEEHVGVPDELFRLARCLSPMERFLEKRVYSAEKLGPVMFPCLPDKSPTSHLKGESLSQAGTSVALYGSR